MGHGKFKLPVGEQKLCAVHCWVSMSDTGDSNITTSGNKSY